MSSRSDQAIVQLLLLSQMVQLSSSDDAKSDEHKLALYAESRRLLDDEIVDQQLKLNELVRQARQPGAGQRQQPL